MNNLFDYAEAQRLKAEGMDLAAANNTTPLAMARAAAKQIAQATDGTCDADRVGAAMEILGIPTGNWMGSLFKGKRWEFTGQRIKSIRKSAHAREIKVWRWVG